MIFPYATYYPNQSDLIDFIKESADKGMNPVFESPTGSGKTISVLSALLPKAVSEGKKILYLCRTHEQMDRVIEELKKIHSKKKVKGISLKSRTALCLNDFIKDKARSTAEERLACTVLKKEGKCSYYKRLSSQDFELESPMTSNEILRLCREKGICPYEFSKNQVSSCNVISLSYLYIFVPEIRAAFLKSTGLGLEDLILVLDEAHNLPKLASDIAGDRLTEFAISRAKSEAEERRVTVALPLLEALERYLIVNANGEKRIEKESLLRFLNDKLEALGSMEDAGEEILKKRMKEGKRPLSFLHTSATFLRRWKESQEGEHAFFISQTSKGTPYLEILSLEPKVITKPPLEGAYLSVHMSGTLTPIEPYCTLIGLSKYRERSFPSPFPEKNIAAFVDPSVTSLGSMRTPEMYMRMAKNIENILRTVPGNVLVFFPSYVVLNSVLNAGINTERKLFIEHSDMTSEENNEMVTIFKSSDNGVLLGVQQGRNSEGQDFPGDQAKAVIVVGIPYAVKGPKVIAQIEYYNRIYKGWWGRYPIGEYYAYFLPAYRALNQSAGRAHRSLSDKAAIIFLERRVAFDKKVTHNISQWIREPMKISKDLIGDISAFYR